MSNPNTAEEILQEILKDLFPMPHQPTTGVKRTVEDNRRDLKERIQEHTAQTLDRLKERVLKKKAWAEDESDIGNSTWNDGYATGIREILQLIEEVSDE